MSVRIRARAATASVLPIIQDDPALLTSFASDAAHVAGGHASGVAFPRSESEVAALVAAARRVLPIGAQSSLTGGATPRGDLLLSTRALTAIGEPVDGLVRVQAGVPIAMLQATLDAWGLYYPPVPTFEGAFIGGTIATNAAGAATFKYGTTRRWVEGLTVVLADGSILDLRRGAHHASAEGAFIIASASGRTYTVHVPTYRMPALPKLSAGYYAAPGMDLIDLFIGSEGTLGVIVDATLRVIARPRGGLALVTCADESQALALTAVLRDRARAAWRGDDDLDVSAIEYLDHHSLALVDEETLGRAGLTRPSARASCLLVQFERTDGRGDVLAALVEAIDAHGIDTDPLIATDDDARGMARLFALREAVPARVNTLVGDATRRVDARIEKTAGDFIVPFDRLPEALRLYRRTFDARGLSYAIWGHLSDGNLHPNVIPRSMEDVERGRDALHDLARAVMAMGGAPLAEHGVGRNPIKQAWLGALYGDTGIAEMRAVKHALDPDDKLAAGVLFESSAT